MKSQIPAIKPPSRLKGLQRPATVERERQVVAWIKKYQADNGYSPSIREIGSQFKMSTSHVRAYFAWLEKGGYMTPRPFGVARAILFTEKEL